MGNCPRPPGLQNNFHYSVFLVTPDGVIVTDPINAEAATWLEAEIARRFDQPVKYLILSHDHRDHSAGGELIHPLILLSNDTKGSLEYPLLHKHLQKPLHQWTDSLIRPVGNMVIQHQPLTKQRVRTIFHRVRL